MSVPSPPLISVRPRVTPTTLEFWWQPPEEPNGTISGYTLSCESPSITQNYGAGVTQALITGLTNTLLSIYSPTTISSSIFFVARLNNTNHTNTIYSMSNPGYYNTPSISISNGNLFKGALGFNGTTGYAAFSNPTQAFIGNINFYNTGSGYYPGADVRINTAVLFGRGSGDAGSLQTTTQIILGSNGAVNSSMATSGGLSGYIFEYIVLPYCADAATANIPATNETRKIEGYLAWKWGLESSLPAGHPYSARAP